jgi:asparagine synthase (glutamine-hydrolysing)
VYRDADSLVFGSELKALLSAPWVPRSVNPQALEDYLTFGMVQGEHCILEDVQRLPAATYAVVQQRHLDVRPHRYWSLNLHPDARWTEAEAVEAVRAKVVDTVRAHMVADVPVGAFLSGGMDSGVVVGVAAGLSPVPLHTFSIGFNEPQFSELAEARTAAARFGTEHHEEIATADSMSLVDELTRYFDEPFADSSAVPTYLVARLAARSVKVALSGDGGDEAFGGYSRYRDDLREWRIRTSLPQRVREKIVTPLATMWPKVDWLPRAFRAKTFLTNVGSPGGAAYANSLAICRTAERRRLLAPGLRSALNGYDPGRLIASTYDRIGDRDPLAAMIAADVEVHLPDDYLTKVDRAAMAHSLEVRPVFVDHELLELTATMPSHFKVRGRTTKWLMRAAYRDFLPHGATRRPKRGFSVPLDLWFRSALDTMFNDTVLASNGALREFLDLAEVRRMFDRHHRGLAHQGSTLWSILILARWCDAYVKRSSGQLSDARVAHLV